MSGPITPPLTVETLDGATTGRPITTIKVSNGDLTVAGNVATIDTSGGGGGGSGTVTSISIKDTSGTSSTAITTAGSFQFVGAGTTSTAVGESAGLAATTGANHTLIGHQAGYQINTGTHNTCLGSGSGGSITTGNENITVGRTAGQDAVANITTASNQIVIGINAHTHAFIKIDWTVTSDERDKMNFGGVPHGLSFVNDLQPIKFDFKKSRDDATPHGKTKYGFKAQDILALEGDSPIIIDNEFEDNLRITNSHLMPVLVKAVQELSTALDAALARITTLEG